MSLRCCVEARELVPDTSGNLPAFSHERARGVCPPSAPSHRPPAQPSPPGAERGMGGAELRASQAREGGCGVAVTLGRNGQRRADMGQEVRGRKTETQ